MVRGCERRCVGSRCLLEWMHERAGSMAAACRRRRELRGSAGRAIVVSSSARRAEIDVVGGAGPGPIVVNPQTILLSSWPVQVQRILLALRQLPQDGLDLRPRLRRRLALIARHRRRRTRSSRRSRNAAPVAGPGRRDSYTSHHCASASPRCAVDSMELMECSAMSSTAATTRWNG